MYPVLMLNWIAASFALPLHGRWQSIGTPRRLEILIRINKHLYKTGIIDGIVHLEYLRVVYKPTKRHIKFHAIGFDTA